MRRYVYYVSATNDIQVNFNTTNLDITTFCVMNGFCAANTIAYA